MTTEQKLIGKYGNPFKADGTIDTDWQKKFEKQYMTLLTYPPDVAAAFPMLGGGVYINKDFVLQYLDFLRELIKRYLAHEVIVNDQCFMVRMIRGSSNSISVHSWGMAVDLNPNNNPLGLTREQAKAKGLTPFTEEFQQCGRDCGLTVGYDFSRCDGMHFENTKNL